MKPTNKTNNNRYYKARTEAAVHNDALKSREGASELLGLHPSTLASWELGTIKTMAPDSVVMMADLYNAPELLPAFCHHECAIGCRTIEAVELHDLDRLTIRLLASLQDIEEVKHSTIDIMADGVIDDHEKHQLKLIMGQLDQIRRVSKELRLYVEKNLKE